MRIRKRPAATEYARSRRFCCSTREKSSSDTPADPLTRAPGPGTIRTMVRKLNHGLGNGSTRVRRRAEARRLEILRAAGRVFRRRGFAATGMREIAAEADLSPGNIYHYFAGKHELLTKEKLR